VSAMPLTHAFGITRSNFASLLRLLPHVRRVNVFNVVVARKLRYGENYMQKVVVTVPGKNVICAITSHVDWIVEYVEVVAGACRHGSGYT